MNGRTRRPGKETIKTQAEQHAAQTILTEALTAHKAAMKEKYTKAQMQMLQSMLSEASDAAQYSRMWAKQENVLDRFTAFLAEITTPELPKVSDTSTTVK